MPSIKSQLRESVLKRRGLKKSGRKIVVDGVDIDREDLTKTLTMKLLEDRFGLPIEQLLWSYTELRPVAAKLGLDVSTVSKWRTRLGVSENPRTVLSA